MRIALAQINPTVGDLEGNAYLMQETAKQARAAGAALVVFPELAVSGYPPEDLLLKDHFVRDCEKQLTELAARCRDVVLLVGAPLRRNGALYNAAVILVGGEIRDWYGKRELPNYAVFDEKRYFTPGNRWLTLELGNTRWLLTVCEDIWDEGPSLRAAVAASGACGVINLSMSPYHVGKGRERETMLARRARAAGAYVLYVNGTGGQDELVFDGHSVVFAPDGRLVARAPQFREDLLVVDVPAEPSATRQPVGSQDATPVEVCTVMVGAEAAAMPPEAGPAAAPLRHTLSELLGPEEEIYRALCVGVRDYARKNGFQQVVMGISGGIDSALTACIAADALGPERVNTVSMPSRYSSAGTRADAREIARRLEVNFYEIPIEGIYQAYLTGLSSYLEWDHPGIAEQNIQARIRGNLVMALSNRFGWLVLTTGNKSEMAVGYATLYGDMAGGFAVLKDVPKTTVYRLAHYRNSLGPGEGPIPRSTIERVPSAELAPGQTDQDTLPPYEILDRIIEAYVVRDESIEEMVASGLDRSVVQKVVAMIDGNEYKRRQAAPGVRITPKAFGKDRRLPITNRYRG